MARPACLLVIMILTASLISADYSDTRNLSLDATDIGKLEIDCGAGFLQIYGDEEINSIEVEAEIIVENLRGRKAEKFIEKYMRLSLEARGSKARLESSFDNVRSIFSSIFSSHDAQINLIIHLPPDMVIDIEDGSGYIRIRDINDDISIDDGSGDIDIVNVDGRIDIDDGSGSIEMSRINGSLIIDDGSGDLDLKQITGNIDIDDGSGETRLVNITGDIEIDDGSGELLINDIDGSVAIDDGSGDIYIENVSQDLTIIEAGSGSLDIANVEGKIRR